MNQVPAHIAARQRRNLVADAVGGINSGVGPHISITDNRFTLVDGSGNEKPVPTFHLDVCVIDANRAVSKIFYDPSAPYVKGQEGSPPICFSDNGVGASSRASRPQSQSCAACQWNAWGSKKNPAGADVKACNDVKKVAVVIPGEPLVFMLRVPPASLKNFAKYSNTLAGHSVDLPDVITRLEFESQGVLKFTPMGYVDEDTAALGDRVLEADATVQMLGKADVPWNGQGQAAQLPNAAPQQGQLPPPPAQGVVNGLGALNPSVQTQTPMFAPPQAQPAPQQNGGMFQQPPGFAGLPPHVQNPMGMPAPQQEPTKTRKPRTLKPVEPGPTAPPFMAPPVQQFAQAPPAGPAPAFDSGIPSFLQRAPTTPTPPVVPAQQQNFGMQPNPPAPDAGMQDALDAAFNLPTS